MTEREDTIERIERVLKLTHKKSITVTIPRLTAERAVSMLKEQEAVKPKCKERMGGFVAGLCPTCGTALNNVLNVKACGKCGQVVKWE